MKIKSISEIRVTKTTPNGDEYGFVIAGNNVNIQLISASTTSYGKHNEPLYRKTYSPYQVLVNDTEISIDGKFEDENNGEFYNGTHTIYNSELLSGDDD